MVCEEVCESERFIAPIGPRAGHSGTAGPAGDHAEGASGRWGPRVRPDGQGCFCGSAWNTKAKRIVTCLAQCFTEKRILNGDYYFRSY